jgi:hypothetical protein
VIVTVLVMSVGWRIVSQPVIDSPVSDPARCIRSLSWRSPEGLKTAMHMGPSDFGRGYQCRRRCKAAKCGRHAQRVWRGLSSARISRVSCGTRAHHCCWSPVADQHQCRPDASSAATPQDQPQPPGYPSHCAPGLTAVPPERPRPSARRAASTSAGTYSAPACSDSFQGQSLHQTSQRPPRAALARTEIYRPPEGLCSRTARSAGVPVRYQPTEDDGCSGSSSGGIRARSSAIVADHFGG